MEVRMSETNTIDPDLQAEQERRDADAAKRRRAVDAVLEERVYQKGRWTPEHDKKHSTQDWASIMAVYTGKVASSTYPYDYVDSEQGKETFKKRVTQLAAICLAALEMVDEA